MSDVKEIIILHLYLLDKVLQFTVLVETLQHTDKYLLPIFTGKPSGSLVVMNSRNF